ncbi:MAG: oligosaccharide flippase family protein, partial [Candidatus Sumerlaeaceae bacterium]
MSRARQHLKGATALTISQAGTRFLSLLTLVIIQKHVTVEENGLFQLALRLSFLLALFTEFGIRGYIVREVARCRSERQLSQTVFGNVLNLRLALVVPVGCIGALILWAAGYSRTTLAVVGFFYVFTVLDSFATLFKFLFRAYDRMEFDAIFSVLGRFLILAGLIVLLQAGHLTVPKIAAVHIGAAGAECLALAVSIPMFLQLSLLHRWDSRGILEALRRSIPFAVINIIGTLYMSTGTIALSKMLGEQAVGYYNAASRLPEALQFLPTAVVNALIP